MRIMGFVGVHASDLEWSRRHSIDRSRHDGPLAGFKGLRTLSYFVLGWDGSGFRGVGDGGWD
jgi:hypothetical protein